MAIEDFRRAAAADPELALAHVGLARCYGMLPRPLVGLLSPADARPAIETATEKALRLDPTLPEAYAERACLKARYDWDWDSAKAEFRQALALNPRSVLAHQVYSSYCTSRGRFAQGQSALARIGAGDEVGFFGWMRRACEERSYALVLLPVFPFVDRFRRDPRFRKMFDGTGLEVSAPMPKATAPKR